MKQTCSRLQQDMTGRTVTVVPGVNRQFRARAEPGTSVWAGARRSPTRRDRAAFQRCRHCCHLATGCKFETNSGRKTAEIDRAYCDRGRLRRGAIRYSATPSASSDKGGGDAAGLALRGSRSTPHTRVDVCIRCWRLWNLAGRRRIADHPRAGLVFAATRARRPSGPSRLYRQ